MTQRELNRRVARATGESVRTVAGMGFVPLTAVPCEADPEDRGIDWDELDAERGVAVMPEQSHPSAVA